MRGFLFICTLAISQTLVVNWQKYFSYHSTRVGLYSPDPIEPLGTKFSENRIEILIFPFKNMHMEMSL